MDGNFSAEHMKMRHPADDVVLTDGTGFMVSSSDYKEHLKIAVDLREVRFTFCGPRLNAIHISAIVFGRNRTAMPIVP